MSAKQFKLDIFKLLQRLTAGERGIWETLSEEERRGFAPLVVQRWLSGTRDERQLMALNQFANPRLFALRQHPQLLLLLLQACTMKQQQGRRYSWPGVKHRAKRELRGRVLAAAYGWSSRELQQCTVWPSDEEVERLASELGWQQDELAKLRKEAKDAQAE